MLSKQTGLSFESVCIPLVVAVHVVEQPAVLENKMIGVLFWAVASQPAQRMKPTVA
jgi:hypothetical protein